MELLIAIILTLLLINIYLSYTALNGNWRSTDDFTEQSNTDLYLNICPSGLAKKSRFVLEKDGATVVLDGYLYFINYNPLSLLNMKCTGLLYTTGFDDFFPKKLYFQYAPTPGYLKIWDKVVYGEFCKI